MHTDDTTTIAVITITANAITDTPAIVNVIAVVGEWGDARIACRIRV